MTKKTGAFEVDVELITSQFSAPRKQKKSSVARYKSFDEALEVVINQMQVSGYRPRTLKDYETIMMNFSKTMKIKCLEEITMDTVYLGLNGMSVSNQTKLTRLKVLKAIRASGVSSKVKNDVIVNIEGQQNCPYVYLLQQE